MDRMRTRTEILEWCEMSCCIAMMAGLIPPFCAGQTIPEDVRISQDHIYLGTQ